MKKIQYVKLLGLLTVLLLLNISCKDDDTLLRGSGITEQSWSTNQTYFASAEQTLTFTFTTLSSWTAQNSSTALLSLDNTAGNSGENTIKVTVHKSSQEQGTITIKVNGYSSTSNIKIQLSNDNVEGYEINYSVDQYLKEKYLWNDDYKLLTPNFRQAYDEFLRNTLLSMTTNTLDKKRNSNGTYSLFSFIQKLDPDLQTSRSAKEKKTLEYNYGFVNFIAVGNRNTSNYGLVIQGVHKGSSADKEGLKRGMEITEIDNQRITTANVQACYSKLIKPSSPTSIKVKDKDGKVYTIDSGPIYVNPIIHHQVNGQTGYLVYSAFESGFDQELFDVFKEFKNQGIEELILDLRYNGGGDVTSANLISSCIAGDFCIGKTFASYRYNDGRMKALNNQRPIQKFVYSLYDNLNTSLSDGGLNLRKIYCLVTDDSASASELVINALRGIDIEVVLIGTTTHGKNVGMEGVELTVDTDKYLLFPITFLFGQSAIQKYAGTAMPYPFIKNLSVLNHDGMVPFYINHLGRHGARFPTSGRALEKVRNVLILAEQEKRLTVKGQELLATVLRLSEAFEGQWGELSAVGEQEQKGIAERMLLRYPEIFVDSARIEAIASYIPRCISSMDAFLSGMEKQDSSLVIKKSAGKQYNPLLRFFDLNKPYVYYKEKGDWISLYESFVQDKIVFTPVMKRIFLTSGQETEQEKREFVMALFSIAAILPDTGLSFNMKGILNDKEWYGYWQTQNLRQYLTKSAAPVGNMLPVAIAWPLLSEFIQTTEQAINGQSDNRVDLRFAHAETVIPFVALMGIGKTDIQIASPDSVSIYWKDYEIAPMAANVQWVFYRDKNCQVWVKILLNEQEVTIPVVTSFFPYYRWEEVCHYLKQRIAISKEILSRFSSKTD